jgi:hypothetical protein
MLACHYLLIILQLHHYNSAFKPLFDLTSLPTVSKGKAIPVKVWTDAGSSRRLKFPDFKTIGT